MMKLNMEKSILILLFLNIFSINIYGQLKDIDDEHMINSIKSTSEACRSLNEKILLSVDAVYFFKNCALHRISDAQLINTLIIDQKKTPFKMSPKVYSALSIGNKYTFEDYYKDFPQEADDFYTSICENFNRKIVSLDDFNYYYIENCRKRKFMSYADAQKFNQTNDPIYSIKKYQLDKIRDGKDIVIESKNINIKEPSESFIQKNLPAKSTLCKNLNRKITSFFDSFYFVDKCVLLPIKEFDMELQILANENGGIQDLSIEQALGLKIGKEISSKEAIKKLR